MDQAKPSSTSSVMEQIRPVLTFVKKYDMFRIVADKDRNLAPATKSGSIMSNVCLFFVIVLILNEAYLFFKTDVRSSMFVSQGKVFASETVHMNISFPLIPCRHLAFEAFDYQNGMTMQEQQRTLRETKYRLLRGTQLLLGPYDESHSMSDEGCQFTGTFKIDKVPGNFMIAGKKAGMSQMNRMSSDHVIHELRVGDDVFTEKELPEKLSNAIGGVSHLNSPHRMVYQYYLQIVPTFFKEERGDRLLKVGFQYVARQGSVQAEVPPGIYFRHEHSALAVEYRYRRETWSHFLVNLCAIVGGVYTMLGLAATSTEWIKRRIESMKK